MVFFLCARHWGYPLTVLSLEQGLMISYYFCDRPYTLTSNHTDGQTDRQTNGQHTIALTAPHATARMAPAIKHKKLL